MLSSKPINIAGTGTFSVNNGAIWMHVCHSLVNVNFQLNNGATLISANESGVNGSISGTGTKTFQNNANYTFNGITPKPPEP
jgi:hypothetical protein